MTTVNELLADLPSSTKPHPLEGVVRKSFADNGHGDLCLTQIANGLGACSHPKRGWDAYWTVAEDVTGYMTGQGKLIRDDRSAPASKRVRDGGYYWRLSGKE